MWKATAGQGPKSGHQASASYRCTEICYMCIYPLGFRGRPYKSTQKRTHLFAALRYYEVPSCAFPFFFAQSPLA